MEFFADLADLPMPLQLVLVFVFGVDLLGAAAWAAWLGEKAIRAAQRRAARRLWREFQRARNAANGSQEAENNFSHALRHCASGLWGPLKFGSTNALDQPRTTTIARSP
jgi:hypothetical protein